MRKRSTEGRPRGGRGNEGREKKLVRATSGKLARMEDTSDWERVERLTDADIEQAIADDPGAAPVLDDALWRNAEILDPCHEKSTITMRVDDDVLDFFKRGGSGYQSRMNARCCARTCTRVGRRRSSSHGDMTGTPSAQARPLAAVPKSRCQNAPNRAEPGCSPRGKPQRVESG